MDNAIKRKAQIGNVYIAISNNSSGSSSISPLWRYRSIPSHIPAYNNTSQPELLSILSLHTPIYRSHLLHNLLVLRLVLHKLHP